MENQPNLEKVDRDVLVAFATERPPRDPEVQAMLVKWIEETSIAETAGALPAEYADAAIMHSIMKYRLGFISTEEVVQELEQVGMGLTEATDEYSLDLYDMLFTRIQEIKTGTFIPDIPYSAE
ncbi:MAG: hypothetical protein V4690_02030 [Patescibacteria group bacterium]